MIELLKKYSTLLILAHIASRVFSVVILSIYPNLLITEEHEGGNSTLGNGYLNQVFELLFNFGFVFLLNYDMKKENIKSNLILIITGFSSMTGVLFFLLVSANIRNRNTKNEMV